MAHLEKGRSRQAGAIADVRGAVYVEFLIAFMPVFVLFLATTQLALLTAARIVVEHAAWAATRSAVVILQDDPDAFDGAPRGSLTEGDSTGVPGANELLLALPLPGSDSVGVPQAEPERDTFAQSGARMVPIRASAYFPLFALAPDASVIEGTPADNVATSLASELGRRAAAALEYTRAATVVSVHGRAGDETLAQHIGKKARVTVRVTYAVYCGVPLARTLICNKLGNLVAPDEHAPGDSESRPVVLGRRFNTVESRSGFERLAASDSRFAVFDAEATLPSQGADYEGGD